MEEETNICGAYNRIARGYAGDLDSEDDPVIRAEWRRLFCDRLRGKKVLEAGCGPGKDSKQLHDMGLDVTATDICEEFIQIVRERYPFLTAHRMDMANPDLPEHSFDGIYAAYSFIHLPRSLSDQTLGGFQRLLKPGGILFMVLLKSSKVAEYVIDDWGDVPDNPALFTCYDEADIEMRLKNTGFTEVGFFYTESPLGAPPPPRIVERGVSHYQLIAVAEQQ